MTKEELEKLELLLSKLEHAPRCHVKENQGLCECGLSEGRRRLYNFIDSCRLELQYAENSR